MRFRKLSASTIAFLLGFLFIGMGASAFVESNSSYSSVKGLVEGHSGSSARCYSYGSFQIEDKEYLFSSKTRSLKNCSRDGEAVTVYYNIANPRDNSLDHPPTYKAAIAALFGAFLLLTAAALKLLPKRTVDA